MTSASISGIHDRSNLNYLSLLSVFGLFPRLAASFRLKLFLPRFLLLLQQAHPVFFPWTYSAYRKRAPKGKLSMASSISDRSLCIDL
jgi:hypothetical protein